MKINIITNNNGYGLSTDYKILTFIIKKHFKNLEINFVDCNTYKSKLVDINIFLETVVNIHMKNAKYNILIPNQEWFSKDWVNYITGFDKLLVKTKYGMEVFKTFTKKDKISYISWKSNDKLKKSIDKDYTKFLHACGASNNKQTQKIIDWWKPEYPKLTVIANKDCVEVNFKQQDNIEYVFERLDDLKFDSLFNSCGVHICASETEGFGHYINEAKLCKSVVITTDAPPMNELINQSNGFLVKSKKKNKNKIALGSRYSICKESFEETIEKIMSMQLDKLKVLGENARDSALLNNSKFESLICDELTKCISEAKKRDKIKTMKEIYDEYKDKLPNISVVTPTYNRPHMLKLILYNYKTTTYPKDKMEWIIVDDGEKKLINDQTIIENLKKHNIKYIELNKKLNIGEKRNLGVEHCSNDIVVFVDDDDYYPPESITLRVIQLLNSGKGCVGCSTIACFHINKFISIINVPPPHFGLEERLSEATFCFYKKFWESGKFSNESLGCEAREFIKDRNQEFLEISWECVIISLLHSRNTSSKITYVDEPNGCHFGWSDELFLFLTNLDKVD